MAHFVSKGPSWRTRLRPIVSDSARETVAAAVVDPEHERSRRVDGHVGGAGAVGGDAAERGERAARRVDGERGDLVVALVGGVEGASIGREREERRVRARVRLRHGREGAGRFAINPADLTGGRLFE